MKTTPLFLRLRALAAFAFAGALTLSAHAATPIASTSKPPAPGCVGKTFVKPGQNLKSGHSYMLMMVFKAGTGGKYFGNSDINTIGCLGVVSETAKGAKASAKVAAVTADEEVYPADICPNNCAEPDDGGNGLTAGKQKAAAKSLDKGTDPLGKYNWGVLSAMETPLNTTVPDNTFEIVQVKVKDACVARKLYVYYSQPGQILATARTAGDFMGQMVIGYRVKTTGQTEPCLL